MVKDGCVERDAEKYPYWPLRKSADEALSRATPLSTESIKDVGDGLVTLEIEFTGPCLCSLWPEVISVEPGAKGQMYKLDDTLRTQVETHDGRLLYAITKIDGVAERK